MCGINKNGNTERRKGEVIMKMKICLIIRENTVLVLSQPRKKGKNILDGYRDSNYYKQLVYLKKMN